MENLSLNEMLDNLASVKAEVHLMKQRHDTGWYVKIEISDDESATAAYQAFSHNAQTRGLNAEEAFRVGYDKIMGIAKHGMPIASYVPAIEYHSPKDDAPIEGRIVEHQEPDDEIPF